jgi:hypothetical protein
MPRKTKAQLDNEQEDLIAALMEVPDHELACRDPGLAHQWNLSENYHVIRARFKGTAMQMIARDSSCGRCGKVKQERWVIGANDILTKVSNLYSRYEVPMTGFSRGKLRANAVWTAGYRKAMQEAAKKARRGQMRAV